jgi:sugar lactone lactonase YvrE
VTTAAVTDVELLLDGLMFPEGPRWRDGRLYFSDFYALEVVAVDLEGRRETIVEVPEQPSGLGWTRGGDLLVVSMLDARLMRYDGHSLSEVADLTPHTPWAANDMVVDAQGRAYVGAMPTVEEGVETEQVALILVDPSTGEARVVADELAYPNGAVITDDGSTLIIAESLGMRLTAFDIATDGSLENRRVWAQLDAVPDGICLDAEGCVWIAAPLAGEHSGYRRIAEGGKIVERLDTPGRAATAVMLGGPDGRALFMLESAEIVGPGTRVRGNGCVKVGRVDVPAAGLP